MKWHGTRKEITRLRDRLSKWSDDAGKHPAVGFVVKVLNKLQSSLDDPGDRVAFEADEKGVKTLISFCCDNSIGEALFLHRTLLACREVEGF